MPGRIWQRMATGSRRKLHVVSTARTKYEAVNDKPSFEALTPVLRNTDVSTHPFKRVREKNSSDLTWVDYVYYFKSST